MPVEYFVKLLSRRPERSVAVDVSSDVDATRLMLNASSSVKFKLLLIPLIVCLASVKLKMYDIESISSSIKASAAPLLSDVAACLR